MKGNGLVTVGLDRTPESVVLARVNGDEIVEVIDVLAYSADAVVAVLAKRNELRATSAHADTLQALACSHDCDENAVYVETDGPIGHGWECGKCGAFLQAG